MVLKLPRGGAVLAMIRFIGTPKMSVLPAPELLPAEPKVALQLVNF